ISADVARSYGGDGGGEDHPSPHHVPNGCMGCFANRGKGKRKPNLGGRAAGRLNTRDKTQNLSLKEITDTKGPVLKERKAALITDIGTQFDLRPHMESPDWTEINAGIQSGGNVLRTLRLTSGLSILSFGMIPGTLPEPLKIDKTVQRARSYLDRDPGRLLAFEMRWSTRRSLTHSSWHTLLTGNSFGMRTDEEMKRLEAMGTYTDDEINRLARGGKQRGHIAGVGRVLPERATTSP
nr:F-box domain, leucine-rich repeat domain, L domain-like protein [Tanacetum cinerariifolium]